MTARGPWRDEDTRREPRREGPAPRPLEALLSAAVSRRRWGARLEGARIHERWREIVGDQLGRHTEPVRLRGGVLVLRAESQAWATQVHYLGSELAARANAVLGPDQVTTVRVVTGALKGTAR